MYLSLPTISPALEVKESQTAGCEDSTKNVPAQKLSHHQESPGLVPKAAAAIEGLPTEAT